MGDRGLIRPLTPAQRRARIAGLRDGRLGRAGRDDRRLTPYLVLRLDPSDIGQRPLMRLLTPGMMTLRLAPEDAPDQPVDFELQGGRRYLVSGLVANLGQAPALMGLARLHIVDGNFLAAHWQEDIAPPFDLIEFEVGPGRETPLRFPRSWKAPEGATGATARINVYIHVIDLLGDSNGFLVTWGWIDRRIMRQDYHVS